MLAFVLSPLLSLRCQTITALLSSLSSVVRSTLRKHILKPVHSIDLSIRLETPFIPFRPSPQPIARATGQYFFRDPELDGPVAAADAKVIFPSANSTPQRPVLVVLREPFLLPPSADDIPSSSRRPHSSAKSPQTHALYSLNPRPHLQLETGTSSCGVTLVTAPPLRLPPLPLLPLLGSSSSASAFVWPRQEV